MKFLLAVALLALGLAPAGPQNADAPAGFDNKSNGMVDEATHQADQTKFDDIETVADGLGPLYNAQSCRECHQNPTSGGTSQVGELRVGHQGSDHLFHNPDIPIAKSITDYIFRWLSLKFDKPTLEEAEEDFLKFGGVSEDDVHASALATSP